MGRWPLILALGLFLPGCDVATAALILGSQDSGSDDDDVLTAPPPEFKAWTALLADTNAADAERNALVLLEGKPSTQVWTEIGVFTATEIFDPSADPNSFNTILITASSTQNYELDCVEILDANNVILETASGNTWSNLVDNPNSIKGPPDGQVATTTATGSIQAFIFSRYNGPIDRFRINGHVPSEPTPGDVLTVGSYDPLSTSSERPGGMAIDASGLIHLTLSVEDLGWLVRYNLTGAKVDEQQISANLAAAGSHSVALNTAGVIYTACSNGSGTVQVSQFAAIDLATGNSVGFASGFDNDRVEHNSIALDSSGSVVVVGGMNSTIIGDNLNHWRVKIAGTLTGSPAWQSSSSLDVSAPDTYWHAVTTGPNEEVFTTGNFFDGTLFGGTNLIYSNRFNSAGTATWSDDFSDGDVPSDVGHAIALDAGGNIFVAGSVGTDTGALDPVLLRYNSLGNLTAVADFAAAGDGNDEILDIAVDQVDGSVYVVGYVTVTGQGENAWVRKYSPSSGFGNPVWERTHHSGGTNNDRAISCAIHGNTLVVAGYETVAGDTKLVLRMYEK